MLVNVPFWVLLYAYVQMFTFNFLQRALSTLLYFPWILPLCGPTQKSSHRFELNLCFTFLSPQAGCLIPHLANFSNDAWCLLHSSHCSWLHYSISPMHSFFSPYSAASPGGEQWPPCWTRCVVFRFLLISPLQLTLPIMSSFKLSSLGFCDGPRSFFFPLLGNLVSFYFVSSCVFSLIVSFFGGLCLPSALHLHPISLDKHIHFYDFHWWYISRPDFSFLLSLIFLAAC